MPSASCARRRRAPRKLRGTARGGSRGLDGGRVCPRTGRRVRLSACDGNRSPRPNPSPWTRCPPTRWTHGRPARAPRRTPWTSGRPPAELDRKAEQRIVRTLEARGASAVRHGVETVASALGVSRLTVYTCLNCEKEN
ncbi:hypothetical protein GCM10010499_23840 [Streptomyces thermoviolaceus subsp. apingens]|nr:hypothetical protein GCM10010499_23840 [Streptomyces thermoviolaceus subsp. apingens]